MSDNVFSATPRRTPWRLGLNRHCDQKHVWSIRTRLLVEGRTDDLAMKAPPNVRSNWLACSLS